MTKFKMSFRGRKLGAIGIYQTFNVSVQAESFKQATEKLYENYQDIHDLKMNLHGMGGMFK